MSAADFFKSPRLRNNSARLQTYSTRSRVRVRVRARVRVRVKVRVKVRVRVRVRVSCSTQGGTSFMDGP